MQWWYVWCCTIKLQWKQHAWGCLLQFVFELGMVIFPASSSFASFATTPTVGKVTPTYAYTNIFGDIPEVLSLILVGKTQISIGQLLNCHLGKLYGRPAPKHWSSNDFAKHWIDQWCRLHRPHAQCLVGCVFSIWASTWNLRILLQDPGAPMVDISKPIIVWLQHHAVMICHDYIFSIGQRMKWSKL